ncbi:MAG: hypothetical protein MZV63_39085 [Marinilabiliales bacterium]|nr:hypothetical protein [Marinilabiliales bacterium]
MVQQDCGAHSAGEIIPGAAIASTGPWSATYGYSSPGDAINPAKNRKHPFEMVTYVYKNKDLGYYAASSMSAPHALRR